MNVLNANTKQVFGKLAQLELIKEFTFIGGTALALQLEHRISEDLDFCLWAENPRQVLVGINEKKILESLTKELENPLTNYCKTKSPQTFLNLN